MDKGIFSKRVKELRSSCGYSQERLADESSLNLRTIQRIESGITLPRGDTLSRLSAALKVSPDELLDWAKEEDKGQLLLINLSALSLIFNPFIGILLTMALWISKRDKVINADEVGKKIINFQLTWLIFLALSVIAFVSVVLTYNGSTTIESLPHADKRILIPSLIFLIFIAFYYIYSIILILINTIRIQKDLTVLFRPSIKFIK